MNDPNSDQLQHLLDRQAIMDCLIRYCRGVDRLDRDLVLSAYHPDARDDHGMFVGNAQEFVECYFNIHSIAQHKTMHTLGNHTCEISGDVAHCETYCTFTGHNRDGTIDQVGCRYLDRMERREGEWRIADRVCVVEWFGSLQVNDNSAVKDAIAELFTNANTERTKSDVSYMRPLRITRENRIPPPLRAVGG